MLRLLNVIVTLPCLLHLNFSTIISDLIPIEMENPDYKDLLESSLQKPIRPTLSLSSPNDKYHQLSTTNYTMTKRILNQNPHFYTANEEKKRKLSHDIFIMNAIHPDEMLQEIRDNMTVSKIASNYFNISFTYFKIMFFLKLFLTSYV